ncbi:MAG: polymerase Rpb6 [Verrucomicrobiota bacterium]
MNKDYLAKALEKINDKNILVNLAAKRAGQLSHNERPLVEIPRDREGKPLALSFIDIALLEIAAEKVKWESVPPEA